MRRQPVNALLVWAAWTALAVFFSITTSLTYLSQGRPPLWGRALALSLAQWWVWAAFTPLIVWTSRRWPLSERTEWRHVLLHLAVSLGVAGIKVETDAWALRAIYAARPYVLINNLALQVLIYWALVAVVHALDRYGRSQARAVRLEVERDAAELALLRAELRPHFLFNALNAISELVHEDPAAADRMIGRLGDLLRATLRGGDRQVVPLADEIGLVEHYLAIQQVRFGDRLTLVWEIDARCLDLEMPPLLLQPIVENAIQHGISPLPAGGSVTIAASADARSLRLVITDDGAGLADGWREGIGLANARRRLDTMYGDAAVVSIAPRAAGGTVVTMTFPRHASGSWSR